jgi:predicted transcriptional regulator
MTTVRLDTATEATLERLAARRGQTRADVLRDAIARLADDESGPITAYQRLEAYAGIADSGGLQLSSDTGRSLRELLESRRAYSSNTPR